MPSDDSEKRPASIFSVRKARVPHRTVLHFLKDINPEVRY